MACAKCESIRLLKESGRLKGVSCLHHLCDDDFNGYDE